MQLRSGKQIANSLYDKHEAKSHLVEDVEKYIYDTHYKNFQMICNQLLDYFEKIKNIQNKFEKIQLVKEIYELVHIKVKDLLYLKEKNERMKHLYMVIKTKIHELLFEINRIIEVNSVIEPENIKLITDCMTVLMIVRNELA